MNIKELAKTAHDTCVSKGFVYDNYSRDLKDAVGELFEGDAWVNRYGCGGWAEFLVSRSNIKSLDMDSVIMQYIKDLNQTVEMEIADCKLRLASLAHGYDKPLEEDMYSRECGEKGRRCETYTDLMLHIMSCVNHRNNIMGMIDSLDRWCEQNGIDLDWFCRVKLEYNKTRPFLHGKA